jgi:hypothetical protein
VIDLLPEQRQLADKGGTMRLGLYPILLTEGSRASRLTGKGIIQERHRHRYEVNNDYLTTLEKHGLRVSGPVGREAAGGDHRARRASRTSWPGSSIPSSARGRGIRTRSSPAS